MVATHQIARGLLLIVLAFQNRMSAAEGVAECEMLDFGVVHCSNIRAVNEDYWDSVEFLLPQYLDYAAFTKGPSIGLLVSDSDLDGFPEDLLEGFNVTHLALVDSDIAVWPAAFVLAISSDVVYLKMQDNSIDDFRWNDGADHLPFASTLTTLILRKSYLLSFDQGAFAAFPSLQDLDLSENFITEVPPRAFANHYTLQTIDLSRNLLHSLGKGAFSGLPSLRKLDLSFNYIFVLEAGTFTELENLNHLNLFDNEIFQVEETTFNQRDVPKLLDLRIAENPLICDCNLQWLKLWLIEHASLEESGATCSYPVVAEFGEVDFCPSYILELNATQL